MLYLSSGVYCSQRSILTNLFLLHRTENFPTAVILKAGSIACIEFIRNGSSSRFRICLHSASYVFIKLTNSSSPQPGFTFDFISSTTYLGLSRQLNSSPWYFIDNEVMLQCLSSVTETQKLV